MNEDIVVIGYCVRCHKQYVKLALDARHGCEVSASPALAEQQSADDPPVLAPK